MDQQWIECHDEQGQVYYFNEETQETSWELPTDGVAKEMDTTKEEMVPNSESKLGSLINDSATVDQNDTTGSRPQTAKEVVAQWIQSFDPQLKSMYYYNSNEDICQYIEPDSYLRSEEDQMTNSVIILQCAFRSRLARTKVYEKRYTPQERLELAKKQAQQKFYTKKVVDAKKQKELEGRRESSERRGMIQEERCQRMEGDSFFGLDIRYKEVKRQRDEEKSMYEAEEHRRQQRKLVEERRAMERKMQNEIATKQRQLDTINEAKERARMSDIEALQCSVDRFWGIEIDLVQRNKFTNAMKMEDELSAQVRRVECETHLHALWKDQAKHNEEKKQLVLAQKEKKHQKQYIKLFNRAKNSEFAINYQWPTRKAIAPKNFKQGLFKRKFKTEIKGYSLEVVYDPSRVLRPKNTFHFSNGAQSSGRKGKLDIFTQRKKYDAGQTSPAKYAKMMKLNDARLSAACPIELDNPAIEIIGAKHTRNNRLPSMKAPSNQFEARSEAKKRLQSHFMQNTERPKSSSNMQEDVVKKIFNLIDFDGSGIINREEMTFALSRDKKLRIMAEKSVILKPILKSKDYDKLFDAMDDDGSGNISWQEFSAYFSKAYDTWHIQEQENALLAPENEVIVAARREKERNRTLQVEDEKARYVFSLIDTDKSGLIDHEELIAALKSNPEVQKFVTQSKSLRPLLDNAMFEEAFKLMNADNDEGISVDEFSAFCTEVASIVLLNDI